MKSGLDAMPLFLLDNLLTSNFDLLHHNIFFQFYSKYVNDISFLLETSILNGLYLIAIMTWMSFSLAPVKR